MYKVEETAFNTVIGYDSIKRDLYTIAYKFVEGGYSDCMPKMILLYGEPGTGKSLLVDCFVRECSKLSGENLIHKFDSFSETVVPANISVYTVKPTGSDFVKEINNTFSCVIAKSDAHNKAIVIIDDLDKFSNEDEDRRDTKEYFTIQSCIDDIGRGNVLVLATVNDLNKLPESLYRSGRCDFLIQLDRSTLGTDGALVANKYLKELGFTGSDLDDLSAIYEIKTPAEIESNALKAKLFSTHENVRKIDMIYTYTGGGVRDYVEGKDKRIRKEIYNTAIHEAGHIIVSEAIREGSVAFGTIAKSSSFSNIEGFVQTRNLGVINEAFTYKDDILYRLGGVAANRFIGESVRGCCGDVNQASEMLFQLFVNESALGFSSNNGSCMPFSANNLQKQETVIQVMLEEYTQKAIDIIRKNKVAFNKIVVFLLKNGYICRSDIDFIMNSVANSREPLSATELYIEENGMVDHYDI